MTGGGGGGGAAVVLQNHALRGVRAHACMSVPAFFVGGYPQLKDTNVLYSHARDRFRLVTEGSGTVSLSHQPLRW